VLQHKLKTYIPPRQDHHILTILSFLPPLLSIHPPLDPIFLFQAGCGGFREAAGRECRWSESIARGLDLQYEIAPMHLPGRRETHTQPCWPRTRYLASRRTAPQSFLEGPSYPNPLERALPPATLLARCCCCCCCCCCWWPTGRRRMVACRILKKGDIHVMHQFAR
jgi:hypothetical protein